MEKIFYVNNLFSMTRVIHYICNIKIKDFLLCQYVIYGPRKKSILDKYVVLLPSSVSKEDESVESDYRLTLNNSNT